MMRHILSSQIADFASICDEDVELVSVERPKSNALEALSEQLFASRQVVQARWEQVAGDHGAPTRALPSSIDPGGIRALIEEITRASDVLSELLGCERVGVRLTTLRGPMCPRFHVDLVPCRMLITISGPGTEWIPSDDVDRAMLADRDTEALPIRAGREIQQLTMGYWSLLKGGAWNNRYDGVVHRSPHQAGERLLVSMDPLFMTSR